MDRKDLWHLLVTHLRLSKVKGWKTDFRPCCGFKISSLQPLAQGSLHPGLEDTSLSGKSFSASGALHTSLGSHWRWILTLATYEHSVMFDPLQLMDCSPPGSSVQNFPGKNTGVGRHFLLQGIFWILGSTASLLSLLHWQADSLPLNHQRRRRQWHPTPVLLPGKSHGQRSLVGCSPWGRKESDTTEWLHFYFSLSCTGEENGNPLQCSCLENPRDGRDSWAAIYGVAQIRTRLKRLSSSSSRTTWEAQHWLKFSADAKLPRPKTLLANTLQNQLLSGMEGTDFGFATPKKQMLIKVRLPNSDS